MPWLAVGVVIFLSVAALAAVGLRYPLARLALAGLCEQQTLSCGARLVTLSPDEIILADVSLSRPDGAKAAASRVGLGLSWRGPFSPEITRVSVTGLQVSAVLQPGSDPLQGVRRLAAPRRAGPVRPVDLDIRDARILLATPLGPVSANIGVSGLFPGRGELSVRLDPAELSLGRTRLSLQEASLSAAFAAEQTSADLSIRIGEAGLTGLDLSQVHFMADGVFSAMPGGQGRLAWAADIGSAGAASFTLAGFSASGEVLFSPSGAPGEGDPFAGVSSWQVQARSETSAFGGLATGPVSLSAGLSQAHGALQGPLRLDATDVVLAGTHAARASFSGTAGMDPPALSGEVVLHSVWPDPAWLAGAGDSQAAFPLPAEADRALACAFLEPSGGLEARFPVVLVPDPSGARLLSDGVLEFASAQGATGRLSDPEGGGWLRAGAGEVVVAGVLELAAGGLGQVTIPIGQARFAASGTQQATLSAGARSQAARAGCGGGQDASAGRIRCLPNSGCAADRNR